MRIGIIGPGALGCLFASRLFSVVNEQDTVLLIDHRPERARLLNRQGILYESQHNKQNFSVPVYSDLTQIGPLDVLFSCVKSYDLLHSLKFAHPLLNPSTLFIFLQNGINHLQYGEPEKLQATPVFATSSEGATRLNTGHIRHAGSGHTHLGFLSTQSAKAEKKLQQLLLFLQKSGLASSITNDILAKLWTKLFVNIGINGLTAIHNRSNGELLESPATVKQMTQLVHEAEQVARAAHITIHDDPLQTTLTVCKRTANNISSMLQDVRNHCPTEINTINGAISRIGKELGIPTPKNDELIAKIKNIEATYLNQEK